MGRRVRDRVAVAIGRERDQPVVLIGDGDAAGDGEGAVGSSVRGAVGAEAGLGDYRCRASETGPVEQPVMTANVTGGLRACGSSRLLRATEVTLWVTARGCQSIDPVRVWGLAEAEFSRDLRPLGGMDIRQERSTGDNVTRRALRSTSRGRRGCGDEGGERGGVNRRRARSARARTGDAAAFEVLVDSRIDRCYRLAWSILSNDADAADATQDALVSAWRQLSRLRIPRPSTAGSTGSSPTPP